MSHELTPDQKDELLKCLTDASATGGFLQVVYEKSLDQETHDWLPNAIATLHNRGDIDAITLFQALKINEGNYDFFTTRHIFEFVLPLLHADILPVMECVIHLVNEADQDLTASILFSPYIEFCLKDPERPFAALDYIKNNGRLKDLFVPTIIAGSRFDEEHYWKETVALVSCGNMELKKGAICSLGKIEHPEGSVLPRRSLSELAEVTQNTTDDNVLALIVCASFDLLQKDNSLLEGVVKLTDLSLSKGGEFSLYVASENLGLHTKQVPEDLIYVYVEHLKNVNYANKGTLDNIDYAIKYLFSSNLELSTKFLEDLLIGNRELRIDVFDSTARKILKNKDDLLNRLATRWLAIGKLELCRVLSDLLRPKHGNSVIHIHIVHKDLISNDPVHLLFIARKAVGHLFFTPVTAASVLISLLKLATDEDIKEAISSLLFESLLINYPATVSAYLKSILEDEDKDVKTHILNALSTIDQYMKNLQGTDEIYEHHSPLEHRHAHLKHFSRGMNEAMKEAESKSSFLPFVSRSFLLYGRKSISYVSQENSPARRMEIPLKEHSVEIEVPRLNNIDPLGLELMLRHLRYKQIIK